ncbi:MAG: ISKra4 family transposase [Thiobacillus sp.]
MIIEVEDRYCKAAKQFLRVLAAIEQAAERGDAVHEVEETTWFGLIETGREMIAAYIQKQEEEVARPKVIEHEGKQLHRLPERRMRPYVSAFGPTPYRRDVYAARETQRQEVVPLDAKLGMPEGNTSYLLQKWSGTKCVKQSYQESRATLLEILGFAPSVNCLEDMVGRAAEHAEIYFAEQEPVEPTTEAEILVATSDCKGVPMRHVDAPRTKRGDDVPRAKRKRLKKGEKNGQKRMACVGGVYSVAPFRRTVDDVLNEILRKEKQQQRPKPRNKRLRAVLTRQVDDKEVNGKDVVFDWLAKEVQQRDPQERRAVVAIMDGETKLRDLQERKIDRAIGILDIWHVTEYLWKLAYCFHPEGSAKAEAFVETYLRKLLEGKVCRAIGGMRQMATKRGLSKAKKAKVEQCLNYFAERCEYMKYDEYLAAGYPIGSGVVEGACRHLVKDRMEQTGMRWRIAGAQAVLSLRDIYVNDDWDTFHADRIQTEQRKLYPYKRRLHAILNCAT